MVHTVEHREQEERETSGRITLSLDWQGNVMRFLALNALLFHRLLALVSLQTWRTFFLLWDVREDILKNVPNPFDNLMVNSMKVDGDHTAVKLQKRHKNTKM